MKKTHLALSALVFLFACLFCSTAFAQADATGVIVRGGLTVPIFQGASVSIAGDEGFGSLTAVGPGIDLAFRNEGIRHRQSGGVFGAVQGREVRRR